MNFHILNLAFTLLRGRRAVTGGGENFAARRSPPPPSRRFTQLVPFFTFQRCDEYGSALIQNAPPTLVQVFDLNIMVNLVVRIRNASYVNSGCTIDGHLIVQVWTSLDAAFVDSLQSIELQPQDQTLSRRFAERNLRRHAFSEILPPGTSGTTSN